VVFDEAVFQPRSLYDPVLGGKPSSGTGFRCTKVGAPLSGTPAELYLPAVVVPVGAVVVLHGCDRIEPHYRQWAQRLADWGY
jgi:hypothetical protein